MMYVWRKWFLPLLILMMSLLYIFFIPEDPFGVKLLFKLIPMGLIILYAYLQFPADRRPSHWLLLAGLLFCMLGDGLLPIWFVFGLGTFLVGHLFYLAAFSRLMAVLVGPLVKSNSHWHLCLVYGRKACR